MARFAGYCEEMGRGLDTAPFRKWIEAIPFADWPQQHPSQMGQLRPAMVNDRQWHSFGDQAIEFLAHINFADLCSGQWGNPMLSVVMPGDFIGSHTDKQGPDWNYRVHFPITSNSHCAIFMDRSYHLQVGCAYRLNTERKHAIFNHGDTPRIHLMIDIFDTRNDGYW